MAARAKRNNGDKLIMALTQEEIRIKAGLDYSKVTSGLTDISGKVKSFAADIKSQLVGAFAAGAVINQLKTSIDYVEQLAQRAEGLGISKSFLQDLENIGSAAGKSSQQMQQLITKFALGVEPGKDIQKEFYKFLDTLEKIKDPADKAKAAFDRLGKSGIILLDVAKDGAAAFKELGKQFDKLSDSQINAVLKADAVMDRFFNKVKIQTAKLISLFSEYWRLNPETATKFSHLQQEDRIAEMQSIRDAQVAKKAAEKNPPTEYQRTRNEEVGDLRQEIFEANETIAEFEKEYKGNYPLGDVEEFYERRDEMLKAKAIKQKSLGRIGQIVRERSVENLGKTLETIPDAGPFKLVRELLEAQHEAMKNIVQKVSIVEIKP